MTCHAVAVPGLVQYLLGPGSGWRDAVLACLDLGVVAFLVHRVLLLIRGTRALNVLVGLFLLGIGYLASQWANLVALNWLLGHFLSYSFIFGVIVLFQADIRRGLARLGRGSFLVASSLDERRAQSGVVDAVARAAVELSRARHGALIALERTGDLSEVAEGGVRIDAAPSAELLLALFHPGGALHDGAAVLQRGRVAAARCLLPLTSSHALSDLGTRHRAAVGLSEEVDAAVVVVSEERGEISLAVDGALHRALDEGALRRQLARLLVEPAPRGVAALLGRLASRPARRGEPPEDHRAAL
jgi:diadenylate cyclase